MRKWRRIKVNDTVVYNEERYVVLKIEEFDETIHVDLKNIKKGNVCRIPLYSCKIETN